MREEHLEYLVCPACRGPLEIGAAQRWSGGRLCEGELWCSDCAVRYPVRGAVPRFVPTESYARSFGFQWTRHPATQLDSRTGTRATATRFFQQTRWPEDMAGEALLEVGSGAGRFTEVLADTGAVVVSLDRSGAVEVNQEQNGHRPNVLVVQADLYTMPVPGGAFDRVFCAGVLQHTPDPEQAFQALLGPLRPGGAVAVDVYARRWYSFLFTKYWVRPVTRRLDPERLYRLCDRWVRTMWPVARRLRRLPGGVHLNRALLVNDNGSLYALDDERRREWAVLDTFDILSPAYDQPQPLSRVRAWFERAGMSDVTVQYGWNGIEARGTRPSAPAAARAAAARTEQRTGK